MEKINTGSIVAKGSIISGIIILASVYGIEGETLLPWYVKVAGGVGLILVGIFQIIQKKNEAK